MTAREMKATRIKKYFMLMEVVEVKDTFMPRRMKFW
jgi:hypothetical protein